MLIQLNIKQFGIIENATIELKNGLTVLSGETGAGKSMILAAISQLSGQRTSTSYIRYGEEKASVEGVFDFPKNKAVVNIFKELDLDIEDEVIIIRRDIYNSGKSVCRVNGTIVNLSTLKKISAYLLDIHEQHDNQILLVEKNHLNLIDSFNKEDINPILRNYREIYKEYKLINEKIENFSYNNMQVTNFEMESSALAGLATLMGHKAVTVCMVIANRLAKEANASYKNTIDGLIEKVLERI